MRSTLEPKRTGRMSRTGDQELAWSVRDAYRSYVAFHSAYEAAESGLITLWTFHTYVYDAGDYTPIVLVTKPTSEAGATRIFDVARLLVREPFAGVAPTPAGLFRTIDALSPTLMIDEADQLYQDKILRAVLNSGVQAGTPVIRARQVFNTFCPKIVAGISGKHPPLTRATLSRCIEFPMRRRGPRDPKIRRFRRATAMPELLPLQMSLQEWSVRAWHELADMEELEPIPGLTDRQWDAFEPLIAIAHLLGNSWEAAAREWATLICSIRPKDPDTAIQIVADCKRVLDAVRGNRIPTAKLAELRNALEVRDYDEDLNARQLGIRLAALGIRPDPNGFRMPRATKLTRGFTFGRGRAPNRVYVEAWADAFERYNVK